MVLLFLGLQKNKPNRRAQGLCFCFFWGFQKNKANRRAQGLCFLFLWCFQKKTIRRAQGLRFCFFGAVRKNKSNRRAQGLYFWFLWGFQKKTNPIRGQRLKGTFAWEKQTEHMPAVRIRFLPPVRPVRELILYISGSVRFPNCRFLGGFRFARFGSRFAVRFANLPENGFLSSLRFDLKVLCSEFVGFQDQCSEISWAWPLKNFVVNLFWDATDLEDFSGIYLKVTTNIYVIFEGSLEDLLSDPLDFVVSFYPGWGCTFVVIFFWPGHGKCSGWGWAELLYSYKILTQQSSPNTNPDSNT